MSPLISVIVPVYNIEAYLPRCLQAISEQTYHNLEIILVDDGSTDESGNICDDFAARDSRARVIHQPNTGLWAARNAGQDAAHGEFLFFPDGDDYFHKDLLRLLYLAINRNPQYDLAIAREKRTGSAFEDVSSSIEPPLIEKTKDEIISEFFARGPDFFYVYMWNKLFRSSLIHDFRSREYVRSQDYDFNLRVFFHIRKAILIDYDLYFWFQHADSLVHQPDSILLAKTCRIRILFRNYCELGTEDDKYRHYFLLDLVGRMVEWRTRYFDRPGFSAFLPECQQYERYLRKDFLSCRDISYTDRMKLFLKFHLSRPYRYFLKATHNL